MVIRRYGRTVSDKLVRRVWAVVTRHPQDGVRTLARRLGYSSASDTVIALQALRDAGYIDYVDHATGRTILVPFIAVKKAR